MEATSSEYKVSSSALDLDALPPNTLSRVLVELVKDGLGRPIRVPVLVAKGRHPGPVFGLTAAVHGNELNGIPVLHRLFNWIEPKKLRGTIVGVMVVNVPGVLMFQREFIDGTDINRIMPGSPDGNISQSYSHRFIHRIVNRFDYLVDLHTASFGRQNSLYVRADLKNDVTAMMAYLQRPQIIVHNPASDTTLRGTAMDLGISSITVEIGDPQLFKPEFIRRALLGIRAVLSHVGMIGKTKMHPGPEPVVCDHSRWIYTDTGGLMTVVPDVGQRIAKGDEIARISNVFGDIVARYEAPEAGIVVGRSVNPVAQTGARIIHLGRIVTPRAAGLHPRPAASSDTAPSADGRSGDA